jgi:DNA primase
MLTPESVQQVINRADIVEIIGQFLKLRKRGINYIANCPFHNEKTPSFNINPSKGIFKCFGCGKGGDVVTFIEEYEKFSFTEAIRWLARFYHIELQETETSDEYKAHQLVEESLRIVNEFAAQYFEDILHNDEEGQLIGRSYFVERGFSKETIKKFRLGYSPDRWDAFLTAALAKGYSKELMEKAGLIKSRDGKTYDSYKGRVIFPIFSNTGRILGFGARILKKNEHAPKYVNSPENELYVKNKVLYGLYQSRQSISKLDECYLVEGYTDVISLHQAGVTNVVASSGTSLTEGQLKLIGNLTRNLTILYDGDAAGVKAALRGLDMALAESFNVKLVLLPEGEDPDSYVQQLGAEQFYDYIQKNKQDVISFRLEIGLKEAGSDPKKKSQLVNEIAETISKINKAEDFSLQQYYIKDSSTRLQIEEAGMISLVNKFIRERLQAEQRLKQREQEKQLEDEMMYASLMQGEPVEYTSQDYFQKDYKEEWQLVRMLIEYGDKPYDENETVAQMFFETIEIDVLENPMARKFTELYWRYWQEHQELPKTTFFTNHPDKEIRSKAADLLHSGFEPSHNWHDKFKIEIAYGEANYKAEVDSSFAYFELKMLRKLLHENIKQIEANPPKEQLLVLIKSHQALKHRERELMNIVIIK